MSSIRTVRKKRNDGTIYETRTIDGIEIDEDGSSAAPNPKPKTRGLASAKYPTRLEIPGLEKIVDRLYRDNTYTQLVTGTKALTNSLKNVDPTDISPELRKLLEKGTVIYKSVGNEKIAFYKDEDGDLWEIPRSSFKRLFRGLGDALEFVSGIVLLGYPLLRIFSYRGEGIKGGVITDRRKTLDELKLERELAKFAQRTNIAISLLKNAKFVYDLIYRR